VVGTVFGIERKGEHFVLVALCICIYLTLLILYKFYRDGINLFFVWDKTILICVLKKKKKINCILGEFDPKMKWILLILCALVTLSGVAGFVFFPKNNNNNNK